LVDKRVIDKMRPYFDEIYGNASSNHNFGKQASKAIKSARKQVASIVNANANEIVFTSGATEAINLGIKGYWEANKHKGNHIITIKTEHKAVLSTCEYLETMGLEVTYLGVDENGIVCLEELKEAVRPDTILISVMYANNEIGVIQHVDDIGEFAHENHIAFFCDASQAIGKIPVDVITSNIDMLCLSAHKFNGPKGIGALYVKNGISIAPQIHGGDQEKGLRGGTYNTPLIVGFGEACRLAVYEFEDRNAAIRKEREKWAAYFENQGLGSVNFKNTKCVPHIMSIELNEDAEGFLLTHASKFAASTGSACNASLMELSHVLKALGKEDGRTIRISV
jgi:cysteine desulfurase